MLRLNRKRREEKKKNSCWDEPRRDFSFFPFCNRMQTTGLGIIFPQSRKKRPPNIYRTSPIAAVSVFASDTLRSDF
jgi:hypothetical protein